AQLSARLLLKAAGQARASATSSSRCGFTSEERGAKPAASARGLAEQAFSQGSAKPGETNAEQKRSSRFGHWTSGCDGRNVQEINSPVPVAAPSGSAGDVAK